MDGSSGRPALGSYARGLALSDLALWVIDIAEDDGIGGACLLAGHYDFAITDCAILFVSP